MHILDEWFGFLGVRGDRGFLKEGVKAYLIAPICRLFTVNFVSVFTLDIYSLIYVYTLLKS